ncbi:MAG: hypothetical protein KDK04_09560 [Candidatus Competibacteraceae bacterium]|nr:hypothetical protein [Candidatus Competibacteraceae bacterium]
MNNKNTTAALEDLTLEAQLEAVRAEREQARSKRFCRSRLDPYRAQLEVLRFSYHASFKELQLWLLHVKRLKITKSAIVQRFQHWTKDCARNHGETSKAAD